MPLADPLHLDAATRVELWRIVGDAIESYYADVRQLDVGGGADLHQAIAAAAQFDFDQQLPPNEVIGRAVEALRGLQPHVLHPRHFGLFDPCADGDGSRGGGPGRGVQPVSGFKSGSPFGVESERALVEKFAQLFGYAPPGCGRGYDLGGSEGNLTGLLLALTARFPGHREHGLRAVTGQPTVYTTRHTHPSVLKAVAITGIGTAAVREVPTDQWHRMDVTALERMVRADRAAGRIPLTVIGTVGTTDGGAIDPIDDVVAVAVRQELWVHVDAAWGGAAVLLPELHSAVGGVHQADSIAFDPHKWLAIPMGCGLLLTRHPGLLDQTFDVAAPFLAGQVNAGVDPHTRSMRWSRDFAGLKLLLSLSVAGWEGYRGALRLQVALARRLRDGLRGHDWTIVNKTPLPVVCFTHDSEQDLAPIIASAVNQTGEAKIFTVRIGKRNVLRACVTNYGTTAADIDLLIALLCRARADVDANVGRTPRV